MKSRWYDGGLLPMKYVFVPTEKEWVKICREYDAPLTTFLEGKPGFCGNFSHPKIGCVCLLYFDPDMLMERDSTVIAGLVAHEATHCIQFLKRWMGEVDEGMGWETEAYATQIITVNILDDLMKYKEELNNGKEQKD